MDRFGKLFGRKTEQPSTSESPALDPQAASHEPSRDAAHAPAPPPEDHSDPVGQPFGLKFVFDSGESRTFTHLPVSIGSSEQNDLVLSDETVSANHALIYYDEQIKDICILDLDSLNGVYISDSPTRKNILQDVARIALGKVHLVFRDTGYIHPA
jgi:hypothetical protein